LKSRIASLETTNEKHTNDINALEGNIDKVNLENDQFQKLIDGLRNDLTEKFYSKTMDEKYKTNAKKELVLDLSNTERVRYCSVCSKEMSVYDGDITEETYGYPICKECLENTLLLQEE
jgi:hypothetical protein